MKKAFLGVLYAAYLAALAFVPPMSAATAETAETVKLPILMYHAVVPDDAEPNKYAIRKKDLAADFDYLKNAGYTTVLSRDLLSFELPEKCVMLTFDDGFLSMLEVADMLAERGMRAVCAVVGAYDGLNKEKKGALYQYLDFDDVSRLDRSGVFEIASHTYDMHKLGKRQGASKMRGESEDEYEKAFKEDITRLQDKLALYGVRPVSMAYPYGLKSARSDNYLNDMGFKISFSCSEGMNYLKRADAYFALKRVNRSGRGADAERILNKLERNN